MITYNGFKAKLEERGAKYRLRKAGISPTIIAKALNGTGGFETVTIDKLCKLLGCQPGDLMEYVDEEEAGDYSPAFGFYFSAPSSHARAMPMISRCSLPMAHRMQI
jgi:putative transcriptional regulator